MQWTRRQFLKASGAAAVALGLGAVCFMPEHGRVAFDDWRALPGMKARLTLDFDSPEGKRVFLVAQTEREQRIVHSLPGAPTLEITVPYVKTDEESFMLFAVVMDHGIPAGVSEPLEVIAESFQFGL